MRPRGPTWPRNDPLGTETSHTGPCSLNVAQLARSIGWVLPPSPSQKPVAVAVECGIKQETGPRAVLYTSCL